MIADLKPYPAMKDSGVPWLREVPEHWEVLRLRNVAEMRVSNVDKHTKDDEQPVRLCNYVDVYKNDRIRLGMAFMRATATTDEIKRFRLCAGDVLITKDSEAWDDIGVPALVEDTVSDPLRGLFSATLTGKPAVVEYEPDSDLRDTEQVPLLEEGGIEAFLRREVLPHTADAWYVPDSVKTGYEVSFTRYFYKPKPLRTLEEIRADILALEKETEGLLGEIIGNERQH